MAPQFRMTEERWALLVQAGAHLASLNVQDALTRVVRLAVPTLGDLCALHILEENGQAHHTTLAHADPEKERRFREMWERYPPVESERHPIARVLRTGQHVLMPRVSDPLLVEDGRSPEHVEMVRSLAPRSLMVIPLNATGAVVGALTFILTDQARRFGRGDLRLAEELGRRVAAAIGHARLYEAERKARLGAEQSALRIARLQAVTSALSEALTPAQVARVVIEQGLVALGAGAGGIVLVSEDGTALEPFASVGYPEDLVQAYPRVALSAHLPQAEAVRAGQPVLLRSVEERSARYPHLAAVNASTPQGAFASLPLMLEGRAIGVLSLHFARAQTFTEDDTVFMLALAQQCAQSVHRARLFQAERRRAEALTALNQVATVIHAALGFDQVMSAIAAAAQRLSGGGTAFAGFFRGRGDVAPTEYHQWEVVGAPREAFEHLGSLHITPLFEPTFRAQGTVRCDDVRTHPLFRGLPEGHLPVVSYLAVPVAARGGQVLGAILLGHPDAGRFDDEVQSLTEVLAHQAAIALENALLYEQEHGIAETLQRSLLPEGLPEIPGISVAVRYLPAGTQSQVGGDWYDVFTLSSGHVGVTIGDVAGRGVQAASLMGRLRNALRAYALEGRPPAVIAQHLDGFVQHLHPGQMATLVYAVFDPATRILRFTNAGHPHPLLVTPEGKATYLTGAHGVPLGMSVTGRYQEETVTLGPGSILLLYTDGLVEEPGEPVEQGLERLAQAAGAPLDPQALCDYVLARILARGARTDDVALLVMRVQPRSDEPLNLRLGADPEALAPLRSRIRGWLRAAGADDREVFELTVACCEACANAIEHAYGPGGGTVEVEASVHEGEVVITVRDAGKWRPPRGINRGRGLVLIDALVDSLEVNPLSHGTTVRMRRRLGRGDSDESGRS